MSTGAASFNLADLFESVVDAVPERTAIVSEERRLTYRQLDERANRLANCWSSLGIGRGDHVGLQLRNGTEYLEAMLAAFKLRAVPININFNYVEGELEYLYKDADMVALLTHQRFAPRVAQVAPGIDKLRHVFCVADDSREQGLDSFLDYEQALAGNSPARHFPERDSDDLYIVYTGGTTGMPKGVMWHHRDIFFAAMGGGDVDQTRGPISLPGELVARITEQPLVVLPTPPFMHAAAQWSAFNALLSGGKTVIPARGSFVPEAIWQGVNDEAANMLAIVGDAIATPLIDCLADNPGRWDTSALLVVASGGALFSPATKQRFMALLPGTMILDGLGSSETGLMGSKISADAAGDDPEPRFRVNEHMTVLNKDNQVIAPGSAEMGYLARKGHVPIGYYKAPEKSAATFVEIENERWAIPGDMARVEADGTILLLGRGSVSINTGGEKVFPEEVESRVKEHEDVLDAVAVGIKDDRYGEIVAIVCQTRSGDTLEVEDLREFCRQRLANFKIPRAVICVENIKRSPAGKADYPWAKQTAEAALR
jgi:acyl-CoA synthetase (AMP-forming)/AMP-acid ligase II